MKSLICALIIFAILAGLVITNAFYVNKTMKNISALVIELENKINEEKKNDFKHGVVKCFSAGRL